MTNKVTALYRNLGRSQSRPLGRNLVHIAGVAALICLLVASGAGVTFALWTSQATAQGGASKAQLTLNADFAGVDFSFENHQLETTGTFVITNSTVTTSTTAGAYTASLGFTGDPALASALQLDVWTLPATGVCAGPESPLSGTWGTFPHTISGALEAGESDSYCVRTSAVSRESVSSANGSMSFQPTISAELTVGSWVASASTDAEQQTAWVYPSHTPDAMTWYRITSLDGSLCVDVEAEANVEGRPVIAFGCKADGNLNNQHWRFESAGTYSRVISRQAPGDETNPPENRGIAVLGGTLDDDGPVIITSAEAEHALWQLQQAEPGVYQFVAQHSGRCLVPGPVQDGVARFVQAACNGSDAQKFKLEVVEPIVDPTSPVIFDKNARYTIFDVETSSCVVPLPGKLAPSHGLTTSAECGGTGWRITDQGNGFNIVLPGAGGVSDLYWSGENGNDKFVLLKSASSGDLQTWNIQRSSDGSFTLEVSGKNCVAIVGSRVKTSKHWCSPGKSFVITKVVELALAPLAVVVPVQDPLACASDARVAVEEHPDDCGAP